MSGCPVSTAVYEGTDAYCDGLSRNSCPYVPGTPEHRDWLCGWDEAEALDFERRENHQLDAAQAAIARAVNSARNSRA